MLKITSAVVYSLNIQIYGLIRHFQPFYTHKTVDSILTKDTTEGISKMNDKKFDLNIQKIVSFYFSYRSSFREFVYLRRACSLHSLSCNIYLCSVSSIFNFKAAAIPTGCFIFIFGIVNSIEWLLKWLMELY